MFFIFFACGGGSVGVGGGVRVRVRVIIIFPLSQINSPTSYFVLCKNVLIST